MLKTIHSFLYLGYHLISRLLRQAALFPRPGLEAFLASYRGDRIFPMDLADKEPAFSRCIACGICDTVCPGITLYSQADFLGPSCLPHISRSIPDFTQSLPSDFDGPCQGCKRCEEVCPEKVPLKRMMTFMRKMIDEND
jgi:ferredoxin